ncbi:MAG: FAD-binding oxidoreductase, partial [Roseibium sp.]
MASGFRKPDEKLLNDLKSIVGDGGWMPGDCTPRYYEDPRGRFHGNGCLILIPDSTQQVSEIVARCNEAMVGVVPFSGGTGVVAGQISIDSDNAIILSLERMNRVREIGLDDGVMVVEAGCILENIHNAALEHDLT